MSGTLLEPGDPEYDEARKVWNAAIDARPALIAMCASADDVAKAVTYAVQNGLEIAVRGGAHGMSGKATVDGGMMIHLGALNRVVVDAPSRRVHVGGGALLRDVVDATQEFALATPIGLIGHTGVGGLTTAGGMGWLSRKHGLALDNVVSAEVVTADGRILRASDTENPDLFWAIRGGGGNFGVVTEFEFALHPVGPMIQLGMLFWGLDHGREVLQLTEEIGVALPAEINVVLAALNAPPAPFVPAEYQLQPGYALLVVGFGSSEEHEGVLSQVRERLAPAWEFVTPMPYAALQVMLDEGNAWGFYGYEKGFQVAELNDDVIAVITERVPKKQSPLTAVLFYRVDGAYSSVPDDATAYAGERRPGWYVFPIAMCPVPEMLAAEREWCRELYAAMEPHLLQRIYVATLDEDRSSVAAAYGAEKYDRLAQIKRTYDPDNVFHRNANITPAAEKQVPAGVS